MNATGERYLDDFWSGYDRRGRIQMQHFNHRVGRREEQRMEIATNSFLPLPSQMAIAENHAVGDCRDSNRLMNN